MINLKIFIFLLILQFTCSTFINNNNIFSIGGGEKQILEYDPYPTTCFPDQYLYNETRNSTGFCFSNANEGTTWNVSIVYEFLNTDNTNPPSVSFGYAIPVDRYDYKCNYLHYSPYFTSVYTGYGTTVKYINPSMDVPVGRFPMIVVDCSVPTNSSCIFKTNGTICLNI